MSRKSTGAGRILAAVAVLLLAYVLSYGPVFGWTSNRYVPLPILNTIDVIYWPIDTAAEAFGLRRPLYWYANKWR